MILLKEKIFFSANKRKINGFNTSKNTYNSHNNSRNFSFRKDNNFLKNISSVHLKSEEEKNPILLNSNTVNTFQNSNINKTSDTNTNISNINPLYKSANNFFHNRQKETEECRQNLSTIATILPELKRTQKYDHITS